VKRRRWRQFTQHEAQILHHALRMLVIYPDTTDAEPATRLADEIWEERFAAPAARVTFRERIGSWFAE